MRYRIETLIDQGGMGTIYRAYDRLLNTWVALKQLHLEPDPVEPAQDATLGDAFRRALAAEFRLLATLRHPHIVSVLDYGFGQKAAFFTMEYLSEGTTIVQAAQGQPWQTQLQLLAQLLQALEYIRRHQVVHRDLKPDNVLVQQGQVKMLDFGLAVLEGQHSTTMGSVLYMAPEAFNAQPLTHAADLFAVGVMAYEILAGQRPFEAFNLQELVRLICYHEPDYTLMVAPRAVRPVIARLLAKDPAARFATAAEALAALAEASGENLPLETQATRASLIQAAQLIGREAELAQLAAALERTLEGQGSAWLVAGENGVGKSRLLDELRIQALVRQAWVWEGQAEHEGGEPAQLWQQVLRWLVLTTTPTELEAAVLKPFVPQLETLLDRPVAEAPALDAAAAQARFCATILDLMRRATAQQPVVLILEDLHWAGPLSRAVLAWVMRAVSELNLLIVATYRDDEQPDLPAQLPPAAQLTLQRLTREQVAALTSAILGLAPEHITDLVTFIYQQTEGNALFVVEVLRSLAEEAGLLGRVQHLTLPEHLAVGGIQQVVRRRLQRIAPEDYPWVELTAVMGRQLDLAVCQQLAKELDWSAWLSRCAEAAVLKPQGAAWSFAHDQIRQGVLAALPQQRQRALHHNLAQALEQVYAKDLTPHLSSLVHHYSHTDRVDKQSHYMWRAGEVAQATYNYTRALDYYERLLPLMPNPATQIELHLRRGSLLEVLGEWPKAEGAYKLALAQSTQHLDDLGTALSQKALGKIAQLRGDYPAALEWLTKAERKAQGSADPQALAQIHTEIGGVYMRLSDLAQAKTQLEKGLALARAENDQATTAAALTNLGIVQVEHGDYAAAEKLHGESLALRREIGDKRGIASSLNNLGIAHYHQGQHAKAQALFEEGLALRREIGDKSGITASLNNLGHLTCLRGDYKSAHKFHSESLALRRELGNKSGVANSLSNLGLVTYLQGKDYHMAWELYRESLSLAQVIREKRLILGNLVGLAAIATIFGQHARAVRLAAAAEKMRRTVQLALEPSEHKLYLHALAAGQADLSDEAFEQAWDAGENMPLDDVIAFALERQYS